MTSKVLHGVRVGAKEVGGVFTGGRDLAFFLGTLDNARATVEAYFAEPAFKKRLPPQIIEWAAALVGEARDAHERLNLRVQRMEKDGVRGAAESSLHALSSAAGALTGLAALDIGRGIADEAVSLTTALNDILARAVRLVTLHNTMMVERLAEKLGEEIPGHEAVSTTLSTFEVDTIPRRVWVQRIEDGYVVAGERFKVSWRTIGQVDRISVRLKNSLGVESNSGRTVFRLTPQEGANNEGSVEAAMPADLTAGKYTCIVSDPRNEMIKGTARTQSVSLQLFCAPGSLSRAAGVRDRGSPCLCLGHSRPPQWHQLQASRSCPRVASWLCAAPSLAHVPCQVQHGECDDLSIPNVGGSLEHFGGGSLSQLPSCRQGRACGNLEPSYDDGFWRCPFSHTPGN